MSVPLALLPCGVQSTHVSFLFGVIMHDVEFQVFSLVFKNKVLTQSAKAHSLVTSTRDCHPRHLTEVEVKDRITKMHTALWLKRSLDCVLC